MYKLLIFIVPEFFLKAIPADYPIFYHTGKNIEKLFI